MKLTEPPLATASMRISQRAAVTAGEAVKGAIRMVDLLVSTPVSLKLIIYYSGHHATIVDDSVSRKQVRLALRRLCKKACRVGSNAYLDGKRG
jgi:uncharacterized protein involved in propanediol utilization